MSSNSTLDPENLPVLPDRSEGQGRGIGSLGPSDSSDTGSDVQGKAKRKKGGGASVDPGNADEFAGLPEADGSDTDAQGTGERVSVDPDEEERDGLDVDVDHIETIRPAR